VLNALPVNHKNACASTYFTIRRGNHQTGLHLKCYRDEVSSITDSFASLSKTPNRTKNSHQLRPSLDHPVTNANWSAWSTHSWQECISHMCYYSILGIHYSV